MSAKSKVLENSFLYTFSALLVKAMGFLLLPIYTRFLSVEDYGIINLVSVFTQVATFIVAFSLYSAVVRFYADYKQHREKLKRFYGTVISFVLISGIILSSLGLIFNNILFSWVFKGISFYPIILVALSTLVFISLHTVHQNIMQGMQQGKKLTIVNLVVFGLQVCFDLLFICGFKLEAVGVLLSNLIINIGYCLFMIIDLKRNNLITICLDLDILKESLKYSIPLMPHNLSTHIANLAARVFINTNSALSLVGLYSVASQFGGIIDVVQSSVNHAFAPWFYETMNDCNKASRIEIINLSNFLLVLYSLVYMVVGLFSQEVIIFMTNKSYIMAWTVIPILVVAYSVKSIYYFYVNVLMYYKETSRKLFIATITGSFTDIVLAYLMVPMYGMYGAAFSFLIAKIIVVTIVVFISKSHDDIGYRISKMLKTIFTSLLFMGIGLYFSYTKYITEFNLSNFSYKLMILFLYLLYLYFTNRKLIHRILKNGELKNIFYKNNKRKGRGATIVIGWCETIYMFFINKTCGVKKYKVVFKSFGGKIYADNPKAISEMLNKLYPKFEIVWLLNNPQEKNNLLPQYVKSVKARSLSALRELATSKVWVDNFNKSLYLYKSKEQVYIQTWHGDRGFKTILHDSPFISANYKLFESVYCDLMVCGSDYGNMKYNTAFKYHGDILKQGCPRNDLLVSNSQSKKNSIKNILNIYNWNILLYAPTLRREAADENKLQSSQNIDLLLVLKTLESITNKEWICIVRSHSAVKGLEGIPNYSEKIIDVSSYEDMTELLLISDFLITDYSSCAGDFALLNRPVILYEPDRSEYMKKDRTFYFNIDSSPFMVAKSNEELVKKILNLDWDKIPQNCKEILDFYGTVETGKSSEMVVEYIVSHINNDKLH